MEPLEIALVSYDFKIKAVGTDESGPFFEICLAQGLFQPVVLKFWSPIATHFQVNEPLKITVAHAQPSQPSVE